MTPDQLLLAEEWQESYQMITALLARQKKDLKEYAAKPDANKKAISIREQSNDIIKDFIDTTYQLVTEQGRMLADANGIYSAHRKLLQRYNKLERYSASKGLDLSLLDHITEKDFRYL